VRAVKIEVDPIGLGERLLDRAVGGN